MDQITPATMPKAKRRYVRVSTVKTPTTEAPASKAPKTGKKIGTGVPVAPAPRVTKADIVIGLLSRSAGATIAQMCEATGWQQHSVRGFLSGTVKKKPGMTLGSDKSDAGRIYRLTTSEAAPA